MNPGIVMYDFNNTKQTIPYSSSAVDGNLPKLGDKVNNLITFLIFICIYMILFCHVVVVVTKRHGVLVCFIYTVSRFKT